MSVRRVPGSEGTMRRGRMKSTTLQPCFNKDTDLKRGFKVLAVERRRDAAFTKHLYVTPDCSEVHSGLALK